MIPGLHCLCLSFQASGSQTHPFKKTFYVLACFSSGPNMVLQRLVAGPARPFPSV